MNKGKMTRIKFVNILEIIAVLVFLFSWLGQEVYGESVLFDWLNRMAGLIVFFCVGYTWGFKSRETPPSKLKQ